MLSQQQCEVRPGHRTAIEMLLDLGVPAVNLELRNAIVSLRGWYQVEIAPKRPTRSARANAYYWAALVTPFYRFLSDQDPCVTNRDQAHVEIKRNVLGTKAIVVGRTTCRIVRTTHDMDAETFADFVNRAEAWLRDDVGIPVMSRDEFAGGEPARAAGA